MLTNITENQTPPVEVIPDYEPPLPPTDLIFDDGVPLESNRHRIAMNVLIYSLQQAWSDRPDYFVGGNMFIYYSSEQLRNKDFRGPDFFVVLNVPNKETRQGWVVWEEQGRYPDVIIELMSPSTKNVDLVLKKELYQNIFRTRDYFVYDPFDPNSLKGWHLDNHFVYQPLTANEKGWLWCETLGFWLGNWQGTLTRETATWLRFYDQQGNLVLLPEEAERQRAENERQRAEQAEQARKEAIPKLLQMGLTVEQIAQALALSIEEVQKVTETLT
jgi:Uma2 family endonuclease